MSNAKIYFKGLGELFSKDINDFLKLIPLCEQFNSSEVSIIYKALYKALELHDGQFRKSGEPYIIHPIGAASILASYGMDYEIVCAALLHDTIEDTSYTIEECINDFGPSIARIVDGATKIGKDVNALTHKKILNNIKFDARFIAVKAGDRLHNLYTLEALNEKKQKEIALETKYFYVPISKILGIYKLKDEFQDLSLFYLDKDAFLKYYEIRCALKDKYSDLLKEFSDEVQKKLSKDFIAMSYDYRIKNVGGIYNELENNKSIENIDDLLAVKMKLKDKADCYDTFNIIKELGYNINSIIDYIIKPKNNGYQSLNLNTKYSDTNLQVRIRTNDMQKKNDLGVFSNWNIETQDKINTDMKRSLESFRKKMNL